MRFLSIVSSLLLLGAATAQSASPSASGSPSCTPTSSDNQVVQLAWYLQFFIDQFSSSVSIDQSLVSSLPDSSSANYAQNLRGLQQKNHLGVRAVQQLGAKVPGFTTPRCNYTVPSAPDGMSYLTMAARLESDVTGAFIGLAGYSQKPEITFLLARLAAEHSAHAAYLGSHLTPAYFHQSNLTTLVPAYPPDYVLKAGSQPGQLGRYLHGCAKQPPGPCGQALLIGPLGANLTSPSVSSSAVASSSSVLFGISSSTPASGSASATPTPGYK